MTAWSQRLLSVCALLTVLLPAPAVAQDRLFIGGVEVGAIGRFGERLGPAPPWIHGDLVGGGFYVVALGPTGFEVIETTTGRVLRAYPNVVAVDPVRPRVFVYEDGGVIWVRDVRTGDGRPLVQVRPWDIGVPPGRFFQGPEYEYVPQTDEFYVRRASAASTPEVAVVDVPSGTVVRTLPDVEAERNVFSSQPTWQVTGDGRRIIVKGAGLRSLDASTGALLSQVPMAWLGSAGVWIDDAFDRVLLSDQHEMAAFDFALRKVGAVSQVGCAQALPASAHTGRVYYLEPVLNRGLQVDLRLVALDGATGRLLDRASVAAALGGFPAYSCDQLTMQLVTAPGAPREVTAAVVGRGQVELRWRNVGDAAAFVVEVGLAPGQTLISQPVGMVTALTYLGVPPGIYYVRVRGGNVMGGGRPSQEIRVVVP